jgi:hypothetical protein
LNGHFIDVIAVVNTICAGNCPAQELPHAIRSNTSVRKYASVRGVALLLCGYRRLSLIFLFKTSRHH